MSDIKELMNHPFANDSSATMETPGYRVWVQRVVGTGYDSARQEEYPGKWVGYSPQDKTFEWHTHPASGNPHHDEVTEAFHQPMYSYGYHGFDDDDDVWKFEAKTSNWWPGFEAKAIVDTDGNPHLIHGHDYHASYANRNNVKPRSWYWIDRNGGVTYDSNIGNGKGDLPRVLALMPEFHHDLDGQNMWDDVWKFEGKEAGIFDSLQQHMGIKPFPWTQQQYEMPPGTKCRFHPQRPAVTAEGFAPMCEDCLAQYRNPQVPPDNIRYVNQK